MTVHDLGQVATRKLLGLQGLVPFERELVVDVWLRVVDKLEFNALKRLNRLNIDDADALTRDCTS